MSGYEEDLMPDYPEERVRVKGRVKIDPRTSGAGMTDALTALVPRPKRGPFCIYCGGTNGQPCTKPSGHYFGKGGA